MNASQKHVKKKREGRRGGNMKAKKVAGEERKQNTRRNKWEKQER